jgi:site-specific DNA recombinase
LAQVADHIAEIITSGTHNQTKALIEALIDRATITARNRLVPVFRIPDPRNDNPAATALPAETTPNISVRTLPAPVGPVGVEPTLART